MNRSIARPTARAGAWALCLAVAAVAGCATTPTEREATAALPTTTATDDPTWPMPTTEFPTTSGAIYVGNIDANIDEYRRIVAERGLPAHRVALAGSLYHRFRVVGRLADAEEAMRELDRAIADDARSPAPYQLRAVVRSGFHRFDDALADLDMAQSLGQPAADLASTRREIDLALGRYDLLQAEFAQSRATTAGLYELAHRADLRVMQGDLPGATFLYRAAQTQYKDTNPVPLAWLHVQQGIALLRFGDVARARDFFAAAHERLPQYYLATEHLAECETLLGNTERARALYRSVITQTGNAEFVAALSMLEREAGNTALADRLQGEADAGYETLLDTYPSAYAQHAAEFYVEIGKPERAYALAQENMAVRRDVGSLILLATTAAAAGDTAAACKARSEALALRLRPPELGELDALAASCG